MFVPCVLFILATNEDALVNVGFRGALSAAIRRERGVLIMRANTKAGG